MGFGTGISKNILPDNRVDSAKLLEMVKCIEHNTNYLRRDVIYTGVDMLLEVCMERLLKLLG